MPVGVTSGDRPLILSMPHVGDVFPGSTADGLVSRELALRDGDWGIPDLYSFAAQLGVTIVCAQVSRTVIDVNRSPDGASLYPGQATTGLCPLTTFDGVALYRPGCEPEKAEIARRRDTVFAPYHAALAGEIARLRHAHPRVVVYDCHSIRSVVPRLFDGILPILNIGTNGGTSAAPELEARVTAACERSGLSRVVNGRFRGGYITRHYGQPADGVHAIQMEIAMRGYLDETALPWPPAYDPVRAAPLTAVLTDIFNQILNWVEQP